MVTKEILSEWKKAREYIGTNEGFDKFKQGVIEAYKKMESFNDTGWRIDVFYNGSYSSPRSQGTTSFCNWHGYGKSCPDCHPVFSVESWRAEETDEEVRTEDDEGNEKQGYLYDKDDGEWIDRNEFVENAIDWLWENHVDFLEITREIDEQTERWEEVEQ